MGVRTYTVRSPGGVEFQICEECSHLVGATKKACPCNGECHPVKLDWGPYYKAAVKARKVADRREKAKKAKRKKGSPRIYYDIDQL